MANSQYQENFSRRADRKGVVKQKTPLDRIESRSRRNFLAKVLTTVGAIAAAKFGKDVGDVVWAKSDQPETLTGVVVEPISKDTAVYDKSLEIAFGKLSSNEEMLERANIEKAKLAVGGILDDKSLLRLTAFENDIERFSRQVKMPRDIEQLFLGIVIAESGVREDAVPDKNLRLDLQAAGLTQMGMEVAGEMGLSSVDRLIPAKVLPASLKHIADQNSIRYENWPIALWAWHTGPKNMYEILRIYFQDARKEELPVVGKDTELSTINLYKSKIAGLSVSKILQNPQVCKLLADKEKWDFTNEYIYRAVAGLELYGEYKKLRGS